MILRIVLLATLALCSGAFPVGTALADDIQEHRSCSECGMDRKAYGYSRMLIQYQDGGKIGVCSLHCAVTELDAHKERRVKSILVADRDTRVMIDAGKAVWVMGGTKRGVMTQRPKWAFKAESAARSFIAANGGSIASWAEAQAAARAEIKPPSPSAKRDYQILPKPGEKIPLGASHYFTYGFTKQPKLGNAVMRVEIFSRDGVRDTSFVVKGDADMPSMRGAHSSGDTDFSRSAKGMYLLPVRLVMPGDWEISFTFIKEGRTVLRGVYLFDL